VASIRERNRFVTRNRARASGFLGGHIPGEVYHQRLESSKDFFVRRLHVHVLFSLVPFTDLKSALVHHLL